MCEWAREVKRSSAWLLALAVLLFMTSFADAQDFRIETEIFVGMNAEPEFKYLTVFVGSATYDFRLTEPLETAIYDMASQQIKLLSPARGVRTEITQSQLLDFTAGLKANVQESVPLFFFACNPMFDVNIDDTNKTVQLSSNLLTYRIQAESPKPSFQSAVSRYQDFADWSARLSAKRAGSLNLPPFARIEANRMVAKQGWIPSDVTRTIVVNSKKQELRSRHAVNWLLPEQDRRLISKANDDLVSLKLVPYPQFAQDDRQAAKKENRR